MPPLPFVANAIKAQLQWSEAEDAHLFTTLYFLYSGGPPNASEALTLATDIYNAAAVPVGQWGVTTNLTGCRVTDLSSSTTGDALHTASTPGTRSGTDVLAGGTSVLVNYTIGRRYRGGKPRNYLPWGLSGDLLDRQTWKPGTVTSFHDSWSTFIGTVLGSVAGSTTLTAHINVSYYQGVTYQAAAAGTKQVATPTRRDVPVKDDIIGFSISPVPASQRRRNRP